MTITADTKTKGFNLSTRDAFVLLLVVGVIVGFPIGYTAWTGVRARQFYARLDTLKLAMQQSDIEAAFRRPADYVCRVQSNTVLYLSRRDLFDGHPASVPNSVDSHKDLPWIYGAGQFLLNADGKLVAYSVIGEEVYVHTSEGDFSGSSIQVLEKSVFDTLTKNSQG